ncbi:MAG: glycosyltransferase family 4 protein [Cytophagales bacterium]
MQITILHSITSGAFGGLEIYVTNLIKEHLKNKDYKIHVLLLENSLIHNELKELNIHFHFLTAAKKVILKDLFSLITNIKNQQIDIVHSHTNKDLPRVSIAKVFTSFKHVYSSYMNPVKGKNNAIHRFLYSKVDIFITTSQITNDFVKQYYPIDPKKVKQLHYGRFLDQYIHNQQARDNFRAQIGANADTIVFGTMCRIDRSKGVKELVEAISLISQPLKSKIKLVIIGDPTIVGKDAEGKIIYENDALATDQWVVAFVAANNLQETVIKLPFQSAFIQLLDAFDVFVLASYQEMYSLAVIDAMLMNKPVIGTNAGGTVEQVKQNERGLLIEPESAKAIASAMEMYINNPQLIDQHGNNAHIWALNSHSMDKMLEKLDQFYKSA